MSADALALYNEMTRLARLYTFRDRDRMGYHGLTITQTHVLHALTNAGTMTLGDLAGEMRLDTSTTSRIVDGLVRRRLVSRTVSGNDGRARCLRATRSGRTVYGRIRAELLEEDVAVLKGFPASTRRTLVQLVKQLTDALAQRTFERVR